MAVSTDLKHLGFADFQITTAASLPLSTLANRATGILCFAFFHLCIEPILGWEGHASFINILIESNLSFQESTVVLLTLPDSPVSIDLYMLILYCFFHLSS